jgi:hypothetical protein
MRHLEELSFTAAVPHRMPPRICGGAEPLAFPWPSAGSSDLIVVTTVGAGVVSAHHHT